MRSLLRRTGVSLVGLAVAIGLGIAGALAQSAASPSFKDLPPGHPAYEAVEYLKAKGVVAGYSDGTFRPGQTVNRAEAIKIIVDPVVTGADLKNFKAGSFTDVASDAWYAPYVEVAFKKLKIIKGPAETNLFHPERTVTKAEFLTMFLPALGSDLRAYSEIKLPFTPDVADPAAWYYPAFRSGLSLSVTMANKDGLLQPERSLTRGDTAIFLHRFFLYHEGKRSQVLLDAVGNDIDAVRRALEKQDITPAEYASARALIGARGALTAAPTENLVKGVVKLAEGYRAIVRAYRAGVGGDFETLIKLAGEAWNLAEQGRKFEPKLAGLIQLQSDAKSLADSARTLKQSSSISSKAP